MAKLEKINVVRDLKKRAYKMLKSCIKDNTLPPGTPLRETELVEFMGVSRTPIREALSMLAQEGLVEIIPRRGTFVKKWTQEETIEIMMIREVIEGLAARLATSNLSGEDLAGMENMFKGFDPKSDNYLKLEERFHSRIIEASESSKIISMAMNLNDSLEMLDFRRYTFRSPKRIRASIKEHRKIIKAFKDRDEKRAEEEMREHLSIARTYYIAQLEQERSNA